MFIDFSIKNQIYKYLLIIIHNLKQLNIIPFIEIYYIPYK